MPQRTLACLCPEALLTPAMVPAQTSTIAASRVLLWCGCGCLFKPSVVKNHYTSSAIVKNSIAAHLNMILNQGAA